MVHSWKTLFSGDIANSVKNNVNKIFTYTHRYVANLYVFFTQIKAIVHLFTYIASKSLEKMFLFICFNCFILKIASTDR